MLSQKISEGVGGWIAVAVDGMEVDRHCGDAGWAGWGEKKQIKKLKCMEDLFYHN